ASNQVQTLQVKRVRTQLPQNLLHKGRRACLGNLFRHITMQVPQTQRLQKERNSIEAHQHCQHQMEASIATNHTHKKNDPTTKVGLHREWALRMQHLYDLSLELFLLHHHSTTDLSLQQPRVWTSHIPIFLHPLLYIQEPPLQILPRGMILVL